MHRLYTLALLLAFALPLTATNAQAQFVLTPYAGFNLEDGYGFLVGIGGEFVAPFEISNLDLSIAPSAEYVFTDFDGFSFFQVNGDVIAKFAPSGSIAPFAGAGLAVGFSSFEGEDVDLGPFGGVIEGEDVSDTDIGLNLLGGVVFPGAFAFGDPYAQGRLTLIGGGNLLSLMAGLRIPLGQN